jgi:hypothetical protein
VSALQPGDLLFTRSSQGAFGRLIRAGAALADKPNLDNHVAIFHHWDPEGTPWVIEGRPGGVGWRDARDYLKSPWTMNNVLQPKTAVQREVVCDIAVKLLGTPYDWNAIAHPPGDRLTSPADWEALVIRHGWSASLR